MTEPLLGPVADHAGVVVEILPAVPASFGVEGVDPGLCPSTDEMGIALSVSAGMARRLVRALLPLCPEPHHGLGVDYSPLVRDRALVDAALLVLGPVFAVDHVVDEGDRDPEPF